MIHAVPMCLDCVFNQAYRITEILEMEDENAWEFLRESMKALSHVPRPTSPLHLTRVIYDILESHGYRDPFRDHKIRSIELAKTLLSELKRFVENANDPLLEALHISAVGNAIDFGQRNTSLEKIRERLDMVLERRFVAPAYPEFLERLKEGNTVLIVGDNAGESVVDTILLCKLKELGLEVYYAVRHVPIINDVTRKDAMDSDVHRCAEIVDSGSTYPGIVLEESSKEFQEVFRRSSVVIAKGQGNLEGLYGTSERVFFLLTPKCPHISRIISVPELTPVFAK